MLNWFIGLAIRMQMCLGGLMDGFSKCAGGLAGCILMGVINVVRSVNYLLCCA